MKWKDGGNLVALSGSADDNKAKEQKYEAPIIAQKSLFWNEASVVSCEWRGSDNLDRNCFCGVYDSSMTVKCWWLICVISSNV